MNHVRTIIVEYLTRPRWWVLFLPLQCIFFGWLGVFYTCLGVLGLMAESGAGDLRTTAAWPVRRTTRATAYWLMAVILIPAAGVLIATVFKPWIAFPVISEEPLSQAWVLARLPFCLGWAGLIFLLAGAGAGRVEYDSESLRNGLATWLLILAMVVQAGVEYCAYRVPQVPVVPIGWTVGLVLVPLSFYLRVPTITRLTVPVAAPSSTSRWLPSHDAMDLFHPNRWPAWIARQGSLMLLAWIVVLMAIQVHWFLGMIAVQMVMPFSLESLRKFGPSLRSLRTLPQSRSRLAFRIALSHGVPAAMIVIGGLGILAVMAGDYLLLAGSLLVFMATFISAQFPMWMRFSMMPGAILCSVIFLIFLFVIMAMTDGFETQSAGGALACTLFSIAVIAGLHYWTYHQLAHNNRAYTSGHWKQMLARKS